MTVNEELLRREENDPESLNRDEWKSLARYHKKKNPSSSTYNETNLLPELSAPQPLSDLIISKTEDENPRAIFRNGYGRKGHFHLLVSITGVGKSTLIFQQIYAWSKGEPGILGIEPVRPLKIAYIGNEDDREELSDFIINMRKGYKGLGWDDQKIKSAESSIFDVSQSFIGLSGTRFTRQLRRLQHEHHYELIIVNPLQSYAGINLSQNDEVTRFFRTELDPVLKDPETECMIIAVHHTLKPSSTSSQAGGRIEANAYLGAGGAELANYARSVLALLPIKNSTASSSSHYWIECTKRNKHLAWKDDTGEPTNKIMIAHSKDLIFWRKPDNDEQKNIRAKSPESTKANAYVEVQGKDIDVLLSALKKKPMTRTELRAFAKTPRSDGGLGSARGERAYNQLLANLAQHGVLERSEGVSKVLLFDGKERSEANRIASPIPICDLQTSSKGSAS